MRQGLIIISILTFFGCSSKTDVDKLNFLKRGNIAYANGQWSEAIRFYNEALVKDSTFADAWNNRGLAEIKSNLFDEAIFSFNKAISYKPGYGEAMLNNVQANLAVHQHFAAIEQLDELRTLWKDSSILDFTAGLIYSEMDKTEDAMRYFQTAYSKDSSNAESLVNIANLFYHNKAYDSAITYIKRAILLDSSEPQAFNILSMTYAAQDKYVEALAAINSAGSINPNDAYIINNKGYLLLKLDSADKAEPYFIQSMKMDPYNGWVYRNLGLLRIQQNKPEEAIRLLEKARSIDESIDNVNLDLARAYFNSGNKDKACENLVLSTNTEATVIMQEMGCK